MNKEIIKELNKFLKTLNLKFAYNIENNKIKMIIYMEDK